MNPYNAEALAFFQKALEDVRAAAEKADRETFERMMNEGKEYFGGKE
jgi:prephenate dehydrogenase